MSGSHWWYLFSQSSEELRIYNQALNLKFSNPCLESCIFKCILWLNGLLFGSDDWGFLKEGAKTYLIAL
jgi:hypothetical protein